MTPPVPMHPKPVVNKRNDRNSKNSKEKRALGSISKRKDKLTPSTSSNAPAEKGSPLSSMADIYGPTRKRVQEPCTEKDGNMVEKDARLPGEKILREPQPQPYRRQLPCSRDKRHQTTATPEAPQLRKAWSRKGKQKGETPPNLQISTGSGVQHQKDSSQNIHTSLRGKIGEVRNCVHGRSGHPMTRKKELGKLVATEDLHS